VTRSGLPFAAAAVALLAGVAPAAPASAAEAKGRRVLPPSASAVVQRAFAEPPAGLRFDGADIAPEEARVRLCRSTSPCATVRLDDPSAACDGATAGPWCVHFEGDAPLTAPEQAEILARLTARSPATIWQNADDATGDRGAATRPDSKAVGHTPAREPLPTGPAHRADWVAWLLALALVLVPLAAGGLAGRGLVRVWPDRVAARRLLALASLPAGFALVVAAVHIDARVPLYDGLLTALLVTLALVSASWRRVPRKAPRAALFVAAALMALGLGAVEFVARRLPPAPPLAAAGDATLIFDAYDFEGACKALYPDAFPEIGPLLHRSEADGKPRVLHLGDSMVTSASIGDALPFPALLEQLDPARHHIGGGVPGTSTDLQLAVARAWLDRASFSQVVLHLFSGNDIVELDRAYTCTDAGPVLDEAARLRFAEPRWAYPLGLIVVRTPPPYPLRVLGTVSVAAAQLVSGFGALTHSLDEPMGLATEGQLGTDAQWRRFDQLLRAFADELAARGVPLTVTVLPHRAFLEAADPASVPTFEAHNRMVAVARGLGLRTLDAGEPFAEAVRRDGSQRTFADTTDYDVHFSAEGHRLFAAWLAERLAAPK
jgi:hypothetical protein